MSWSYVVAVMVSSELGAAFLGLQGDGWDVQNDTFPAMLGVFINRAITWMVVRRQRG